MCETIGMSVDKAKKYLKYDGPIHLLPRHDLNGKYPKFTSIYDKGAKD